MRPEFEAPELKFVGQANDVVAGPSIGGGDSPLQAAPDFEFEADQPLS
jgi:hypothetical protein